MRRFQEWEQKKKSHDGFLMIERAKKGCQMGHIGCPIFLLALEGIVEFQFPACFWMGFIGLLTKLVNPASVYWSKPCKVVL